MEKGSHSNSSWLCIKCVVQIGLQLFFPLLKMWYMIHFGVLISFQKENNTVEGCEVCVYVGLKLYINSPYKVEHMGPACVKVKS